MSSHHHQCDASARYERYVRWYLSTYATPELTGFPFEQSLTILNIVRPSSIRYPFGSVSVRRALVGVPFVSTYSLPLPIRCRSAECRPMPTMGAVNDDYVKVIPFCVPLPSSSSFLPTVLAETNSSNIGNGSPVETGFGIVGTITLRSRSAVVWFGWGEIETVVDGGDDECDFLAKDANGISSVGNGEVIKLSKR